MSDTKIGWRRLDGENAWVGVRGRVKFFTLRIDTHNWLMGKEVEDESNTFVFTLTYHMDGGRSEGLVKMTLSEAKVHAEKELDEWLAKAGLVKPEPPTLTQRAIASALDIVEACRKDGITSLATDDGRVTLARCIALYTTLSTLTEIAVIKEGIEATNEPVLVLLERRREELYEVMADLKELI